MSIPTSLRLQKKMLVDKFPEASSPSWFLVLFPEEMKYSVVEKRSMVEENPVFSGTVKDGKGNEWKCQVVYKGTKEDCKKRQKKLESILTKASEIEDETNVVEMEPPRKKKKDAVNEEKIDDEEPDDQEEEREVMDEVKRVNALLKANQPVKVSNSKVLFSEELLRELFDGVYKRLDAMSSLLQQQTKAERHPVENKGGFAHSPRASLALNEDTVIPQSPSSSKESEASDTNYEEFVYNGTNLLTHVNAKAKKPKLYATALLSLLFSDQEMRIGSVEPKDGGMKKPALDQVKVDLLKKCIKVRYGEKILEKNWTDIRTSLNQKCLDKLKAHRKLIKEEKNEEEGLTPL